MTLRSRKFTCAITAAAAFSSVATPVAALDLPRLGAVQVYDGDAGNVERDRRAPGWQQRRWRGHDGIDAGDVIAGVLVLGAVAAIADAASERYRERAPDPRYRSSAEAWDRSVDSGLTRAVDTCVDELGYAGEEVVVIERAGRDGAGWQVAGALERGGAFTCRLDSTGRVTDVAVDGPQQSWGYGNAPAERVGGPEYDEGDDSDYRAGEDRQYDDEYYARARAGD